MGSMASGGWTGAHSAADSGCDTRWAERGGCGIANAWGNAVLPSGTSCCTDPVSRRMEWAASGRDMWWWDDTTKQVASPAGWRGYAWRTALGCDADVGDECSLSWFAAKHPSSSSTSRAQVKETAARVTLPAPAESQRVAGDAVHAMGGGHVKASEGVGRQAPQRPRSSSLAVKPLLSALGEVEEAPARAAGGGGGGGSGGKTAPLSPPHSRAVPSASVAAARVVAEPSPAAMVVARRIRRPQWCHDDDDGDEAVVSALPLPSPPDCGITNSFVVRRPGPTIGVPMARGAGPSEAERVWLRALSALAAAHSSAGFGNPGALQPGKARRQYAFARAAQQLWPKFGRLSAVSLGSLVASGALAPAARAASTTAVGESGEPLPEKEPQWLSDAAACATECVDPHCAFWRNGQARYFSVLASCFDAMQACATSEERRFELLADLGFHLSENFLGEEEEAALLEYWSPDGALYARGALEVFTQRRFFHYGPIHPKVQCSTAKSTLGVTPAVFGAPPPLVRELRLLERVRALCEREGLGTAEDLGFDEVYVNHYAVTSRARIDFHHDHHLTMLGVVAGISCGSTCEFQLRAQDAGVRRPPARVNLPARSLFLLTGLSRWHLQHAIPVIKGDRLSLTFRAVDRTSAPRPMWSREWHELGTAEEENAHWPLLRPDGMASDAWLVGRADREACAKS
eukprot:NODE_2517_length_2198_cov_3.844037.p1 GENE.NODE_2517_length_2198_cov_3.844037~~NODE_2517_length_2198_cov_3.844037.p1  ORF type:complete len:687 (+),score=186.88 NODE_2517_length_2198_cov_3.844037:2-2062(+)